MDLSINNSNNRPTFKGMTPEHVQRFIPDIAPHIVQNLSANLEKALPNDVLQVVDNSGKSIVRCMKFGGMSIPIGEYKYTGSDCALERMGFLAQIVKDITSKG